MFQNNAICGEPGGGDERRGGVAGHAAARHVAPQQAQLATGAAHAHARTGNALLQL